MNSKNISDPVEGCHKQFIMKICDVKFQKTMREVWFIWKIMLQFLSRLFLWLPEVKRPFARPKPEDKTYCFAPSKVSDRLDV